MRAADVATAASAECSDNPSARSDVASLAKAAPSKKRKVNEGERLDSRHCSRGVQRSLAKHSTFQLEPYVFSAPLWDATNEVSKPSDVAMLLPHDLLDRMIPEGKEEEYCKFVAGQEGFEHDVGSWCERTHCDMSGSFVAPCALWGDAAPYSRRDSIYVLVLTLLSGVHRIYWKLCCLTKRSICDCGCHGRHTFDQLFAVISWSFRACLAGEHPAFDHTGAAWPIGSARARLAGQRLRVRGALIRFLGDWAWIKQSLGLRGWRGEGTDRQICWLCPASLQGACPCYDFRSNADWVQSLTTMAQYWTATRFQDVFVSTLWSIPGMTILNVEPDFMHCSCLGIVQYLNGNVLWELFVQAGGTRTNWKGACGQLMGMIRTAAKELHMDPPISQLTIGMIRGKRGPKAKLKAAEGRYLLKVLVYILPNYYSCETDHELLRFRSASFLKRVYDELDHWQDGGESTRRLEDLGRRHLLLYAELSNEAELASEGALEWRLFPKHHLFAHCTRGQLTNPKSTWAYRLEGEIGKCVEIAAGCNVLHMQTMFIRRIIQTM